MKTIVKKNILKVKPYIPGKPIEEVRRQFKLKEVIKLASNENPFGPSSKVLRAINKTARNINRYPDSDCYYLRQKLAKKLKVHPAQLIFGNGSDEIIVAATRAFTGKGDEVIVARPSFLIYEIASKISGASLKFVDLKNFRYDLEAMRKAISKKTKLIFIGNPDNPAGTYVTAKELTRFLGSIRKNILVFMDEAYFEFVAKKDYPDTIKLLKRYKNLIVTRTFSKIYGLAGLRIGYGIANEETIEILQRIREPFNVNSIAQAAALACLEDQGYYRKIGRILEKERRYLYRALSKMGLSFRKTVTNFILIDTKNDSFLCAQALLKKGIIVRDMGFWGLDTCIRVTIGRPSENRKFIKALKEICS